MRPAGWLHLTVISALAAACQAAAPTSAGPTPTTRAAPSGPSASPTPVLRAELTGVVVQPGRAPAAWTVLGWLDNGPEAVRDVQVRVRLLDAAGESLEEQVVPLALPWLGPGGRSPFAAEFAAAGGVTAQAEIASYAPAETAPLQLDVSIISQSPTGDGRLAVFGQMANPHPAAVRVLGLAVAAQSGDSLTGLSSNWIGLTAIDPGASVPFTALLPQTASSIDLTSLSVARPLAASAGQPIAVETEPDLALDPQNHPIVRFSLRNNSRTPALARAVVVLHSGGDLVGLGEFASPIPLAPDEVRAAAVTGFPGLAPRLATGQLDPADLKVSLQLDRVGIAAAPTAELHLEVTQFEAIGGSLFIHGTAYNQGADVVLSPTVIGALRSTAGEVWSAGEVAVADELAAGAHADFLLVLPLAAGTQPSTGEFDLRGLGLSP